MDDREPYVGKITQKAVLFGPDGEVLLTRVGDRWEPPGGTFEFGETLVGGLRRELREELGLDTRIGPPVEALYGGWVDGSGTPMVTLVYRCDTDETAVTLNEEHDSFEWVPPEIASERLDFMGRRLSRAVARAAALDPEPPFEPIADPYADTDVTTGDVLEALAEARESEPPREDGRQ